jgi:hypothetical protein
LATPTSTRYRRRSIVPPCCKINQPDLLRLNRILIFLTTFLVSSLLVFAQADGPQSASSATVPRLIRIQGTVQDETGKPLAASTGITFSLYKDENDQAAIWQENQNVMLDSAGRYDVLLGASNEGGLPLEIFSAGDGRWLGVRPDGQAEQPRILLLSVPYALKAADTEMLGGKPASAFALAGSQSTLVEPASGAPVAFAASLPISQALNGGTVALPMGLSPQTTCSITSDGSATANQISKFTSACNIESSAIFESGGKVGIGNTNPAGMLDVSGAAFIRGTLSALGGTTMPPVSAATTTESFASAPLDLQASVFNTITPGPVTYDFRWQADGVGNDSAKTSATLNLLYGTSGVFNQTGLSVAGNGILIFAPGQTFPGTGTGTVTNVATGAGLTGGPITKTGTISIPAAGVTNAMLANSSVTVKAGTGLSGGGTVALGGTVSLSSMATGTVTSVNTGAGLSGGPVTTTGTISIPAGGVTNTLLANPSITVQAGSGLSGGGTVALGGTVTLTNSAPSSGGTVANVSTGAGLSGGPITKTGTIRISAGGVTNSLLANPSVTVKAGTGLSGGGTVALGGTVTLAGNFSGTTDGIAYFSSPASLISTPAPTNGQILIGSSGNAPVLGTLTAGQNISITNDPGSVTISATGGGGSPTLPFFITGAARTGATQALAQNATRLWGFLLPYNVTTTEVTYDIPAVDNTANNYDLGIYDGSGNLLVDIGPTPGTVFASAKGFKTLNWVQGSTNLVTGRYYLGLTTNCASACAQIEAASSNVSFAANAAAGTSKGGALPATAPPPSDTWAIAYQPTVVIH